MAICAPKKISTISCKIQAFGKKIANHAHGKISKLSTYQNHKNTTRVSKKRLIFTKSAVCFLLKYDRNIIVVG